MSIETRIFDRIYSKIPNISIPNYPINNLEFVIQKDITNGSISGINLDINSSQGRVGCTIDTSNDNVKCVSNGKFTNDFFGRAQRRVANATIEQLVTPFVKEKWETFKTTLPILQELDIQKIMIQPSVRTVIQNADISYICEVEGCFRKE